MSRVLPESPGRFLLVRADGPVSVVTMNRPDKLNCMGPGVWAEMRELIDGLERDGRTRVVIFTGAGDKAFSAGGDIAPRGLDTLEQKRRYLDDCLRAFARIEQSTLPIIAAVNGWALGGGCELTLACDVVIASDRARFGMPESAIGPHPRIRRAAGAGSDRAADDEASGHDGGEHRCGGGAADRTGAARGAAR